MSAKVLSEAVGYAVVIGIGLLFALFMTLLTYAQKRYLNEELTSENFMTALRSVKIGLTAAAVVSSWTWAATLLQSSTVAYKYGVSGPFWYASGATVQVLLFAVLASEVKRKAPNAHTFLEIIRARYPGRASHIVFMVFALLTNMIVTAMLILGGSAVVTDLTGMSVYAACMLIPIGVTIYVIAGGIKATFLTDYVHTAIIYIIILVFGFTVYSSSDLIGSPSKMFDLLAKAAGVHPVEGNAGGEYLTMTSTGGLIFGIINIVGNFGTVFVDQAYFQRAIAARPSSTVKAYLIGGLSWFAIPFFLATTLGLAGVALESNPVFPSYPNRMTASDVSAGLVAPNAAVALLGSGGAFAVLLLVFMAVTSASSAELIAVASIFTYDVYRTYIKPDATGKQLVDISHWFIGAFGIVMGVLGIVLKEIGISLGYLYLLMGVLVASAVPPIAFTLTWRKQNAYGAVAGAVVGMVAGIAAWLGVAQSVYGVISLDSTGGDYPMLAGNLVSLGASAIVSIVVSLIKPDNYDWESTKAIAQVYDERDKEDFDPSENDPDKLAAAAKFAYWSSLVLTFVLIILWPIPMYFSNYVFSSGFFTGWVVVGFTWAWIASITIIGLPLWESRDGFGRMVAGIWADITGKRRSKLVAIPLDQSTDDEASKLAA
ncbi:Sodium:solute symporter family-domain-containing protein [Cladochytrium replicatum]|nr:Sodium:solute symporter family-domain-containing protein [Cladochytrium replicatum]